MKPLLKEGELSVGVNINVNHLAPTPADEEIKAVAIFDGIQGKLYQFRVELHDRGGLAGSGVHTRAVVSTERLLAGASARVSTKNAE